MDVWAQLHDYEPVVYISRTIIIIWVKLCLQYFYNKLQVVTCYLFKFETNTKITFLFPTIITSNNLTLKIYCKNIVNISFILLFCWILTAIVVAFISMFNSHNLFFKKKKILIISLRIVYDNSTFFSTAFFQLSCLQILNEMLQWRRCNEISIPNWNVRYCNLIINLLSSSSRYFPHLITPSLIYLVLAF